MQILTNNTKNLHRIRLKPRTPYHINRLRESNNIECILITCNLRVTVIWKTILQAMSLSKILVDYVSCSRTSTAWHSRLVEQELLTLPEHMSSVLVFTGVYIVRSFVVYVELCKSLFALFFGPLYCMSSFKLPLLITPLLSSKCSWKA
jgi:hypothetical protein